MSHILEPTTQSFSFEKYESKYQNCCPVIQVALWTIIAIGITLALLSHFGSLDHSFLYLGVFGSIVPFIISIGILFSKNNHLSLALSEVEKIEDLQIIVNTIHGSSSNCSLIGCVTGFGNCTGANMDFIITSTKLNGTISNSELQNVINRLLDQATDNCKNPLKEKTKLAFEQLCDLANTKCEAYTHYNNFEIPNKYLN
jgi:hypothetical protein